MQSIICALLLAWLASGAFAEPAEPVAPIDHGFVGAGTIAVFEDSIGLALVFHGGWRPVTRAPVWLRAVAQLGAIDGGGSQRAGGGGLETRACFARPACIFGGVDLGYLSKRVTEDAMTEQFRGPLLMIRTGGDFGGRRVRVRGGFEIRRHYTAERTIEGLGLFGLVDYRL